MAEERRVLERLAKLFRGRRLRWYNSSRVERRVATILTLEGYLDVDWVNDRTLVTTKKDERGNP